MVNGKANVVFSALVVKRKKYFKDTVSGNDASDKHSRVIKLSF